MIRITTRRSSHFGYDLPFGWNPGLPAGEPYDDGRWATNWNVQSKGVQVRRVETTTAFDADGNPVLFRDVVAAYRSYRNAYPGEIGDRNALRDPGFVRLGTGLMKSFALPWEGKRVVFRWDTFNLANTQRFTGVLDNNRRLGVGPYLDGTLSADFGKFTRIQVICTNTCSARSRSRARTGNSARRATSSR